MQHIAALYEDGPPSKAAAGQLPLEGTGIHSDRAFAQRHPRTWLQDRHAHEALPDQLLLPLGVVLPFHAAQGVLMRSQVADHQVHAGVAGGQALGSLRDVQLCSRQRLSI